MGRSRLRGALPALAMRAGLAVFVVAATCGVSAVAEKASTEPKTLGAVALNPGASGAAYVVYEQIKSTGRGKVDVYYQAVSDGKKVLVQSSAAGTSVLDLRAMALTWSPDGSMLAYRIFDGAKWRVHIWRKSDKSNTTLSEPCGDQTSSCVGNLEWDTDSEGLFYISKLAGKGPSSHLAANEVVYANTLGQIKRLYAAPVLQDLHLSPNGELLLVGSFVQQKRPSDRNYYLNWYLVPAQGVRGIQVLNDRNRILKESLLLKPAWSPNSRKIAFLEQSAGPRRGGGIYLYDLHSSTARDLAPATLVLERGERPPTVSLSQADVPNGRFGAHAIGAGLVWTAGGDGVYALRPADFGISYRTRLWLIPLNGTPRNLTSGAAYDVGLPQAGSSNGLLLPIRFKGGRSGFVELEGDNGHLGRLSLIDGELQTRVGLRLSSDPKSGKVAFISSSNKRADELYIFDDRDRSTVQLTHVNRDFSPRVTVHEVRWTAKSGPHVGYLFLPTAASNKILPLIVQVYPREPSSLPVDGEQIPGEYHQFLPIVESLLDTGYAVLIPDLPVVGGGHTCEDVSENLSDALVAAAKTHLVDADRSAIIGHSFGGWAAECAITRVHRFKLAVSIAGLSNLIEATFSRDVSNRSWSVGGGQTDINKSIWDAPDLYWKESPISGVPRIRQPLLLAHGTADTTASIVQSQQMLVALSDQHKPVGLVICEGADHDAVQYCSKSNAEIEAWVLKYVGRP